MSSNYLQLGWYERLYLSSSYTLVGSVYSFDWQARSTGRRQWTAVFFLSSLQVLVTSTSQDCPTSPNDTLTAFLSFITTKTA